MTNLYIFLADFATCGAVWAAWHFGVIQPKLAQLEKMMADRLAGK